MNFSKELPTWNNTGSAPSSTLKNNGWSAGDFVPAPVLNWQWNRTSSALSEIRSKLEEITATSAELNKLHGATVKTEELNKLSGTTVTTSDLNKLHQVTADATELNKLDGATVTTEELNKLHGATVTTDDINVLQGIKSGYEASASYWGYAGIDTPDTNIGNFLVNEIAENSEKRRYSPIWVNGNIDDNGYYQETANEGDNHNGDPYSTRLSWGNLDSSGDFCTVKGRFANALGYSTIANSFQTVFGKYNEEKTGGELTTQRLGNSLFLIGNGTSKDSRHNAFRVTESGKCYSWDSFGSSGAGVAEMYEWKDGNPDNEDRRGLFLTLDGDKIKIATPQDDYILGVVDPCPFIVGDVHSEEWKNKYLTDIFGTKLTEIVDVPETKDKDGKVIIPAHKAERYILNPEYNSEMEYISRDERKEFATVTSKGKVVMIDDGSCKVNSYCTVGEGGIATASENNYAVRVLERIDDTHIRVYIDSVFINKI